MTSSGEVGFCRVCRGMLPASEFPRGNRSTCRACKTARERERVSSDPERHRAARRQRYALQQLRTQLGVDAAGRVLGRAGELLAAVEAGTVSARDARAELVDEFEALVRDAEDQHGVDPGDGLTAIYRRA